MPDALYIRVRNWEKFQHYKDRNPPWIKNYVELDDASHPFSKLSYADQGRLQKVWRLAAKLGNHIPYDFIYIGRYMEMKPAAAEEFVRRMTGECPQLSRQSAGIWLQVGNQKEIKRLTDSEKRSANKPKRASKPLASRKQSATPEVETEKEVEKETSAVNSERLPLLGQQRLVQEAISKAPFTKAAA